MASGARTGRRKAAAIAPASSPREAPGPCCPMSRKASENVEYTLRSLSSLKGERRRKQQEPDAAIAAGERSLLAAAESSSSLQSAGAGSGGGVGDLERAARQQFQQDETPAFVYVVAVFSALGGFLFGYDTGVVSGAMLLLKRQLSLDALWQELLVSSTVGAAAVSALAGGALNGVFGRRAAILLASALFTAGSAVLAAANNKETLLAGRLVVGLGIGEFGLCKGNPGTLALPLLTLIAAFLLHLRGPRQVLAGPRILPSTSLVLRAHLLVPLLRLAP